MESDSSEDCLTNPNLHRELLKIAGISMDPYWCEKLNLY